MKKIKSIYLVIIGLCIGLLIGYIFVRAHFKNEITMFKHRAKFQQLVTSTIIKVHDNITLSENEIYNGPYLRSLIHRDLVELNRALPEKDTSDYILAVGHVINSYVGLMDLKKENSRLKKLLEFYENEYVPCSQMNINFGFMMNKKLQDNKTLTYDELKKYNIPLDESFKDGYYDLSSSIYDINTELVIIQTNTKHLYGYLVSKNLDKPIKVYHSKMKGYACDKVHSKLYDNGVLEVFEHNCENSETTTRHHTLR